MSAVAEVVQWLMLSGAVQNIKHMHKRVGPNQLENKYKKDNMSWYTKCISSQVIVQVKQKPQETLLYFKYRRDH